MPDDVDEVGERVSTLPSEPAQPPKLDLSAAKDDPVAKDSGLRRSTLLAEAPLTDAASPRPNGGAWGFQSSLHPRPSLVSSSVVQPEEVTEVTAMTLEQLEDRNSSHGGTCAGSNSCLTRGRRSSATETLALEELPSVGRCRPRAPCMRTASTCSLHFVATRSRNPSTQGRLTAPLLTCCLCPWLVPPLCAGHLAEAGWTRALADNIKSVAAVTGVMGGGSMPNSPHGSVLGARGSLTGVKYGTALGVGAAPNAVMAGFRPSGSGLKSSSGAGGLPGGPVGSATLVTELEEFDGGERRDRRQEGGGEGGSKEAR